MALVLTIKVIPQAGRTEWRLDKNGTLKCYLTQPALDNRANKELVSVVAQALSIAQRCVRIVGGTTARLKRLEIDTALSLESVLERLGVAYQLSLKNGDT